MDSEIKKVLQEHAPAMIELRRVLHQNPELAYQEYVTTKYIKEELLACGATLLEDILPTGAVAIFGKETGKTIMVRQDIDALPMKELTDLPYASKNDACHSCGHDIHTTSLLLLAKGLASCQDKLQGRVVLVFQPAEEGAGGAIKMIDAGLMEKLPKIDSVIGFHVDCDTPVGKIGITKGPACASSDGVSITVHSKGGHGAHPYRCADPITTAGYLLTQLQTVISRENPAVQPAVLTFGTINGGTAANIIPTEVTMKGSLRSFNEQGRHKMWESIKRVSECCCQAMRAEVSVNIHEGLPVLLNDPEICDKIALATRKVLGDDSVIWGEYPSPGSDDFACFLSYAKGVQFRVGTSNDDPNSKLGIHNPKTIFDERAIYNGALVMQEYICNELF
ncbi:MAG: M20 family metallopeptidase [Clostridia bacterium]